MILSGPALLALPTEWTQAAFIFGSFLLVALVVAVLWRFLIKRWVATTSSTLDDVVARAVKSLVVWALILAGGYYASLQVSSLYDDSVIWPLLGRAFTIAWILLAVATTIRVLNAVAKWRLEQTAHQGAESVRDLATRTAFFRKLLIAVVISLGLLFVLSAAGVDIGPVLAGGALTGIVVGIALQDTLSNVFAGFFLNIDRPVKIGDYIKLESGDEGFVEEIGWRYTKVRLWANNLLIIPNNKLSQSIITNFNLPAEPLSIYVTCGVSYDSDLEHVERIAIEVATQVQKEQDGGDRSWEPLVRYKTFGESAINFVTILRAVEVAAQHRIHHEFMKALHRRFGEEGIVVPFPIRTVILKQDSAGPTLAVTPPSS